MTAPDDLLAAVTAGVLRELSEAGEESWPVRRVRRENDEVRRLIRLGEAVDACSRVPGESVVRDGDGRPVSSASVLLARLLDAGRQP